MITTKQRCYLKSLANNLDPVFQIGKEGITEEFMVQILAYLNKHEIMKISILKNSDVTKEMLLAAFEVCGIEFIQMVGRNVTIYKESENAKNKIVLPVKDNNKNKKSR